MNATNKQHNDGFTLVDTTWPAGFPADIDLVVGSELRHTDGSVGDSHLPILLDRFRCQIYKLEFVLPALAMLEWLSERGQTTACG